MRNVRSLRLGKQRVFQVCVNSKRKQLISLPSCISCFSGGKLFTSRVPTVHMYEYTLITFCVATQQLEFTELLAFNSEKYILIESSQDFLLQISKKIKAT